jgi:glutamate formiminotransferase
MEFFQIGSHEGDHPRIGMVDTCVFVPFQGGSIEDCVALTHKFGQRVGEELHIPVYLYAHAATRPERKRLTYFYAQQFEKLQHLIGQDPAWAPDYGQAQIHPTAGAMALGVQVSCLACHVTLKSRKIEVAQQIAQSLWEDAEGGLSGVDAFAVALSERTLVQVIAMLTDCHKTSLKTVMDAICENAAAQRVKVVESQLAGLVPWSALSPLVQESLKLREFAPRQILEYRLAEQERNPLQSPRAFVQALSAPLPTPGAGSALALTGSVAAALSNMAAGIALTELKGQDTKEVTAPLLPKIQALQDHLFHLVQEDSEASASLLAAPELPKKTDEEKKDKEEALRQTAVRSVLIPMDIMKQMLNVLEILPGLAEQASPHLPELNVAHRLGMAVLEGSALLVRSNLVRIMDGEVRDAIQSQMAAILERGRQIPFAPGKPGNFS